MLFAFFRARYSMSSSSLRLSAHSLKRLRSATKSILGTE